LKSAREKHQTHQTGRTWNEVFQELKENNIKTRLLFPANSLITVEIKTFHDK
jgi:hypothetical protein